jgi:hypothetical protein
MIDVVEYGPHHLKAIRLAECHCTEQPTAVGSNAVTLMTGTTVIAILTGGIVASGVMQVCALVSKEAKSYPFAFHRTVKQIINFYFKQLKLRRMQMSVRTDHLEGWKWAKALGFSCEGVMARYGRDGSDYWLFARVI